MSAELFLWALFALVFLGGALEVAAAVKLYREGQTLWFGLACMWAVAAAAWLVKFIWTL